MKRKHRKNLDRDRDRIIRHRSAMTLGTLRGASFSEVLAYFRRAQTIMGEVNTLKEFNMRSSGHPIGEGRDLRSLSNVFEHLRGYVDMCIRNLESIQNSPERRRAFERFFEREANLSACMDALSDTVQRFFAVRMDASELPSFILSIIDSKLLQYDADPGYNRSFRDTDLLWLIRDATRSNPPPVGTDWQQILDLVHDHIDERLSQWIRRNEDDPDPRRAIQVRVLRSNLAQRNRNG